MSQRKEEPAGQTAGMEQVVRFNDVNATDGGLGRQAKKQLAPHHVEDLARSGISEEAAIRNGLWSATDEEVAEILGRSDVGAGLAIPFLGIDGLPLRDEKERPFIRVKPDNPERGKYLSRAGSGQEIFIPRGVAKLVTDGIVFVTEGEKKAIAATENGFPCLGLLGNWGWKRAKKERVLAELEKIIRELDVAILSLVWDSDAALNPAFADSTIRLAQALSKIKVELEVSVIPGNGSKKVGLDDFLLSEGVDSFIQLSDAASKIDKRMKSTQTLIAWAPNFIKTLESIGADDELKEFVEDGLNKISRSPIDVRDTVLLMLEDTGRADVAVILESLIRKNPSIVPSTRLVLTPHVFGSRIISINDFAKKFYSHMPENTFFNFAGGLSFITQNLDIETLTPVSLQARISKYFRLGMLTNKSKPFGIRYLAKLPKSDAEVVLQTPEIDNYVSPLSCVLSSPILVGDKGSLRPSDPGYNRECGGFFVKGSHPVPEVCLEEAIFKLKDLLSGFHFATPSDFSRAIAWIITPALRLSALIDGHIPIGIFEADEKQTGKTLFVECAAAIYGEVPYTLTQREGGVGSFDESFSQALCRGRPFVTLDNFRNRLDSKALEAFLTSPIFPARIPYKVQLGINTRKFILSLTSNGLRVTPDLAARACFIRILNRGLGFQFPTWEDRLTILPYIQKYQIQFLGCVFSLVQEWDRQGRPRVDVRQHSFRDWAGIVGWIVQDLLGLAPLLDDHEEIQNRTATPDRVWLRQIAIIIAKGHPEVKLSASQIAESSRDHEVHVPGVTDPTDTAGAAKRIGQIMGAVFRDTRSVTVDNVVITRHLDRDDQGRELKRYAFGPRQDNPTDPASPDAPQALQGTSQDQPSAAYPAGEGSEKNGTEGEPSPQARKLSKNNNGSIIEEGYFSDSDVGSCTCVESSQKACGLAVASIVSPPSPQIWSGQRLGSRTIALDTETTVIEGHAVPTLVLASASDGTSSFVISRENLPAFLRRHRRCRWVFHNASFDFWVLQEALGDHPRLQKLLWRKARDGELGDTMLLDQLLRIAHDGTAHVRDLGTVAAEVAWIHVDKDDPFRLRYAEIIGKPLDEVDPGFLSYAAADAFATAQVYAVLRARAEAEMQRHTDTIRPDAIERFGALTEEIQIRGAIALSDIERRGIYTTPKKLDRKKGVR